MPRKRTATAEQTNETPTAEGVADSATPIADPARDENVIAPPLHPSAQPVAERQPGDDSHLEPPKEGGQKKQSYTGRLVALPDGTKAHYRDYDNRDGVEVHFEFPKEGEKPPAEVTEPLKEHHDRRRRFNWDKKAAKKWQKDVGQNPVAERLDAEERFQTAVERLKESRGVKDKETDGPAF
jgi:hypothetical protein